MIKVNSEKLQFALALIADVSPQEADPHMKILRFCRLVVKDTKITFYGADFSKRGSITIDAEESDKDFECILPLQELMSLVSIYKKGSEFVTLDFLSKKIHVYDDFGGKNKLSYGVLEDYPLVEPAEEKGIDIIPAELVSKMSLSLFTDPSSDTFRNIHLVSGNNELIIEATNMYSGGRSITEVSYDAEFDVAVDALIANPLTRMAKNAGEDETWNLSIESGKLFVTGNNWFISFALHGGNYPNSLEKAVNNSEINYVNVDRESLIYTLQKVTAIAEYPQVKLSIKDGIITLSNKEGATHSLAGTFENEPDNEVVLHSYNLRKILSEIKTDEVTLQIGELGEQFVIPDGDIVYFTVPYKRL